MSGCSRRAFLAAAAGACLGAESSSAKGESFPSNARRYFDPATEFPVVRVTSPEYGSAFIPSHNRDFLGRNSLLVASDRSGAEEVFRLDLKGGEMRQLTSAQSLDPASIAVLAGGRSFCFFDGASLREANAATLRERELYRVPDGVERTGALVTSPDRTRAYFAERAAGRYRLRSISFSRAPQARTVLESEDEITDIAPRPERAELVYRAAGSVFLASLDGVRKIRLPLPAGWIGPMHWSPQGKSILYLHTPAEHEGLHVIREFAPESGEDKLVAKTTQFIDFAPNADASVFVGASGSKAAPHVLILVRSVRRELTVCEHRASNPALVHPHFSPDSQRIVFASDRHGRPAIYEVAVERLVEETESE
jgi:oligogalacturonide lyase